MDGKSNAIRRLAAWYLGAVDAADRLFAPDRRRPEPDTLTGLGRHLEALACLRRSLATFRDFGNRFGEAAALHGVGTTCRAMGQPTHAMRYLARAVALYRELDDQAHAEAASSALAVLGKN